MSKYQKTAKDKAWDREREKLNSQISILRQEIVQITNISSTYTDTIQKQADKITELKSVIADLTKSDVETVVKGYHSAKQLMDMIHTFQTNIDR